MAEICSLACGKTKDWFAWVVGENGVGEWKEKEEYFSLHNSSRFESNPYDIFPGVQGKKWPRKKNANNPDDDKNTNEEQDLSGFSDEEEGNDEMEGMEENVDYGSLLADLGFVAPEQKTLGPMFVTMVAMGDENVW